MVADGAFVPARELAHHEPSIVPLAVAMNSQPNCVGASSRTSRTNEGAARMYAKNPQKLAPAIQASVLNLGLRANVARFPTMRAACNGLRPWLGSVSGSQRQVAASNASGYASRNQKIDRQPALVSRYPPRIGATTGASVKARLTRAN